MQTAVNQARGTLEMIDTLTDDLVRGLPEETAKPDDALMQTITDGLTAGLENAGEVRYTDNSEDFTSEQLIRELEENNIKFTKENIVFITKDQTGQTVWLEKGNSSGGLEHITIRHADDFLSKNGVEESSIPAYLKSVFQTGEIEYSRISRNNGGFEKLYKYNGQYYLLSGIGENGFIVSAYPIGDAEAMKLIGRYKK